MLPLFIISNKEMSEKEIKEQIFVLYKKKSNMLSSQSAPICGYVHGIGYVVD